MADELSTAASGSDAIKLLESSEKGLVDNVTKILGEKPELLNYQEEETGHTPLHKACLTGKLEVAQALLAAGAEPNLDDANNQTCLHFAAKAYAEDTTGDFCFEDIIVALVEGGAISLTDRSKKLPDVGEDAATKVQSMMDVAERKGKAESKEREQQRKDRGMDAFGDALNKHLTNASTCVGVVGVKSFSEPGSTGK
mmetsp:Transcript_16629/g.22924  ORF Transcript_16629/g.22924 Transcript_16629/m.22924 type:complete len:197 (+) Transcript_16629:155-745(+)|eukprot:CAMPEP_0196581302 /NCGR_PEP_ID=MMETSP1081-20130531/33531_1 /TAXON_ID=36882 /ORGANISM="Pyramimonas amylifera, Strain CCMP720" /LENGTH=196 /DNA_ID=CAMNT_0041901491 /DNA_START=83 /DNA_END=673 /DNA_ORIENTATION=-